MNKGSTVKRRSVMVLVLLICCIVSWANSRLYVSFSGAEMTGLVEVTEDAQIEVDESGIANNSTLSAELSMRGGNYTATVHYIAKADATFTVYSPFTYN